MTVPGVRTSVCHALTTVGFVSGCVLFLLCLGRPKKHLGDLRGAHVALFLSTGPGEGGGPGLGVLQKGKGENSEATYLESPSSLAGSSSASWTSSTSSWIMSFRP